MVIFSSRKPGNPDGKFEEIRNWKLCRERKEKKLNKTS